MYGGGVYNDGICYQGSCSAGTAIRRPIGTLCGGLLHLASATAGLPITHHLTPQRETFDQRMDDVRNPAARTPKAVSPGVAVGFLPVLSFWLSVTRLSSVRDRLGFAALVSL